MRSGDWLGGLAGAAADIDIAHLTLDSRAVRPGDAFIALSGSVHDGHDFVSSAANQGAALIVAERDVTPCAVPDHCGSGIA